MPAPVTPPPASDEWRLSHAEQGDTYLSKAMALENTTGSHEDEATAYAVIAAAHYIAAMISI